MKKFIVVCGALALLAPLALAAPEVGTEKMEKPAKVAKPAAARAAKGVAHLRILHAIADAPAADVFLDGKKVADNVTFKTISDYLPIDSGKTTVKLTPTGKTDTLFEDSFTATRDGYYTVAVYGMAAKPMMANQNDNTGKSDEKKARIRVFHLVEGAPAVNITTPSTRAKDGATDVIKKLEVGKDATKLVAPGKMTLQVRADGKLLKEMPDVTIEAGKRYAVFAVGKPDAIELIVAPMHSEEAPPKP